MTVGADPLAKKSARFVFVIFHLLIFASSSLLSPSLSTHAFTFAGELIMRLAFVFKEHHHVPSKLCPFQPVLLFIFFTVLPLLFQLLSFE